jgi:hypothetical protein
MLDMMLVGFAAIGLFSLLALGIMVAKTLNKIKYAEQKDDE